MWLMLEEGDGHQISLATLSNSTGLGATENRTNTLYKTNKTIKICSFILRDIS